MASIIDTTRIVDLPTKASLSEGDVFVVDNENGATSKISAAAVSGSSTAGLVAEEYSDAGTYEVGEYCIHVEAGIPKLYKCTTAIAAAEAWTPAHWEGTDAGTEITDLNQNLTELDVYVKGNTLNALAKITTYTSVSPYTCPKDGFIVIQSASTIGSMTSVFNPINQYVPFARTEPVRQGYPQTISIFVKKGMQFYVSKTTGSDGEVYFCGID